MRILIPFADSALPLFLLTHQVLSPRIIKRHEKKKRKNCQVFIFCLDKISTRIYIADECECLSFMRNTRENKNWHNFHCELYRRTLAKINKLLKVTFSLRTEEAQKISRKETPYCTLQWNFTHWKIYISSHVNISLINVKNVKCLKLFAACCVCDAIEIETTRLSTLKIMAHKYFHFFFFPPLMLCVSLS